MSKFRREFMRGTVHRLSSFITCNAFVLCSRVFTSLIFVAVDFYALSSQIRNFKSYYNNKPTECVSRALMQGSVTYI